MTPWLRYLIAFVVFCHGSIAKSLAASSAQRLPASEGLAPVPGLAWLEVDNRF